MLENPAISGDVVAPVGRSARPADGRRTQSVKLRDAWPYDVSHKTNDTHDGDAADDDIVNVALGEETMQRKRYALPSSGG